MIGLYGKIPAQADFLRVNAGEWSRLGLDRWFQEAHEVVHGERGRLPDEPAFFVLAPAGGKTAFVGALAPSQDAVGRHFPLIAFTSLESSALAARWTAAPTAYGGLFEQAAALLADAATLTPPEAGARAQAIDAARVADAAGDDGDGVLARENLAPLGLALGSLPHGAAYALKTLLAACEQTRRAPAGGAGATATITIDAPAPTDAARLFWLELVRRRLAWKDGFPSFLWTRGLAGRLLVSLGAPPNNVLAFLANPRHKSSRLWPLRTEVDAALDSAVAALTADERRVLDSPGQTLADALAAFG